MAALLCLLCLPAALALHVQRLDMRMASRESYFFGSLSKPTAATLHSPSAFVERESERVAAPAVPKTSYSFGARVPRMDRPERPESERVGLFRESSEEKGYAATPSQPEGRSQMKVDYSFGARLRSPSVPRPRSREPVPTVTPPEPFVARQSMDTQSALSSKVDYSFGARLKRGPMSSPQSASENFFTVAVEPQRVGTTPVKINYSFGARLKPIARQQVHAPASIDASLATSRSSNSLTSDESSALSKSIYPLGARLLRGGEFESAFQAHSIMTAEYPVPTSFSGNDEKKSYFFGARSQLTQRDNVVSRSVAPVGV